jgi:hypothetical protein
MEFQGNYLHFYEDITLLKFQCLLNGNVTYPSAKGQAMDLEFDSGNFSCQRFS